MHFHLKWHETNLLLQEVGGYAYYIK